MTHKSVLLAGTLAALRASSAIAGHIQQIAAAWSRYAEDLVRYT